MLQVLPGWRTVPTQPVPFTVYAETTAGSGLVTLAEVTVKASEPLFLTVTVCVLGVPRVTLPNGTGFGPTVKVEPAPVPVSATRELTPVSFGISRFAVREPVACGLNCTAIVQVAPGASCAQVVWAATIE